MVSKRRLNIWSCHTSKIKLLSSFLIRTYNSSTDAIWRYGFIWDTNFNMWNHKYDLIKCGPNLFKICHMVALPYEDTDIDLTFSTLSLVFPNLVKFDLFCDGIFSIDSYDQQIFLILCWKFMTVWWVWYFINDRRYCRILIIQ